MTNSGEQTKQASEPGPYKEIRAEQFTLVDPAGAEHARLRIAGGGAVLTLLDSKGRPRIRLRAGTDEAKITISGARGEVGKDVSPADDEVERVKIGYESAAQEPRVFISDGNERECVELSIFAEGDGFVCLRRPRDGSHTLVSIDGLIASNSDGNILAAVAAPEETKDRPAAATEPTPIDARARDGADNSTADAQVETENRFGFFLNSDRSRGFVGMEDIRELVDRIIPRDEDDAVKAFVALVDRIAYETDQSERDSLALYACDAAYQRTVVYHDEAEKFFDEAVAESGLRASQQPQDLPCAEG